MKLSNREINALAGEIKSRDEKETTSKQKEFTKKFLSEAKKWYKYYSKLPECLKSTGYGNYCESEQRIADTLAKEDKHYPQSRYTYSSNIERVIVLSMIDSKDMDELIKKVEAYKF